MPITHKDGIAGRVLVVDDERTTLLLVSHHLGQAGLTVDTASSVREAQEAIAGNPYDCVLVDLYMPEQDGFDLLGWVAEQHPKVVTLVLSATQQVQDVVRALEMGAFDFCSKPVDHNVLIERVRHAIKHRQLERDNERLLAEVQQKNGELQSRLAQLELAHHVLQSQALAIQTDLNHAQDIQQSLLPKELPFSDRLTLAAFYQPAHQVGGDFFDLFALDDRHMGLYIADTAGHGVSSALMTVFLKYSVLPIIGEQKGHSPVQPGTVLRSLNRLLFDEPFAHDLFISMTYLVLNVRTMELRYANAGHPPLQLRREDGGMEVLRLTAPALGINPDVKYGTARCTLSPSDTLVMHSDGVTDAQDSSGAFFGRERMLECLAQTGEPTEIVRRLEQELVGFTGSATYSDDTTLLALRGEPQRKCTILRLPKMQFDQEQEEAATAGVLSASESGCTFIRVLGSCTWQESQKIVSLFNQARTEGQSLVLMDFSACTHLDSTFLGVLHSLCAESDASPQITVQLQNVPRSILKLMSELGLTQVLLHFRGKARPLPETMTRVSEGSVRSAEMGALLLSAHQALVEADSSNADRFAAVLEVLHRQVHGEKAPAASGVTETGE